MTAPLTVRTTTVVEVEPLDLSARLTVHFCQHADDRIAASVYDRDERRTIASREGPTAEAALAGALEALRELHAAIGEVLR